jgi:hypothetical protein
MKYHKGAFNGGVSELWLPEDNLEQIAVNLKLHDLEHQQKCQFENCL